MAAHQDDETRGEGDADDVADNDLAVEILEVRDNTIHQAGEEETYQTEKTHTNIDTHLQLGYFTQVDTGSPVMASANNLCVP